jgi:hypothetical protein
MEAGQSYTDTRLETYLRFPGSIQFRFIAAKESIQYRVVNCLVRFNPEIRPGYWNLSHGVTGNRISDMHKCSRPFQCSPSLAGSIIPYHLTCYTFIISDRVLELLACQKFYFCTWSMMIDHFVLMLIRGDMDVEYEHAWFWFKLDYYEMVFRRCGYGSDVRWESRRGFSGREITGRIPSRVPCLIGSRSNRYRLAFRRVYRGATDKYHSDRLLRSKWPDHENFYFQKAI